MVEVELNQSAQRDVKKLMRKYRAEFATVMQTAIDSIQENPFPRYNRQVNQLREIDPPQYEYKQGRYRIIFYINDTYVTIIKVAFKSHDRDSYQI